MCDICRAFRRLLFQEEDSTKTGGTAPKGRSAPGGGTVNSPPNVSHLFQQDYVVHIRPSTLLDYFVSCGPTQLLSPYDIIPGVGLQAYIEDLTAVGDVGSDQVKLIGREHLSNLFKDYVWSVRSLYCGSGGQWRRIENERKNWELIQQCLDSFFQRIAVAESAQQKQEMRAWYESILDLGSQFYGSSGK